ncbi:F-box domain-containing protein [Biscogniauxia marginata]|nr:F-box domain-containing protein [Biscogniauxia marginata]
MAGDGASQASSSWAAEDGLDENTTQGSEASGNSPKPSITLNVPNPAVTYGRLNPEIEENVAIVESVSDEGLRGNITDRYNMLSSDVSTKVSVNRGSSSSSTGGTDLHASSSSADYSSSINLPALPSELIASIFSYLSPLELSVVSLVCRALHSHAFADIQWQRHVLSNLPGNQIKSPYPCKSWRELYISHDPHWFLTKHKLWFGDRGLTGQMVIARYDERRGCIEGYQLLATRLRDGSEPWLADQTVHIHYFEPNVKLHLDKPILKFDVGNLDRRDGSSSNTHPFFSEQPMHYNRGSDPRFSNFLLAKPLDEISLTTYMSSAFPYGHVWPPPTIPARHRVLGRPHTADEFPVVPTEIWGPMKRSDASDQTFRIRQWMEMGLPTLGVHFGEEFVTYSTLDPSLYTPTPEKPWRGIWVGDYSGHGCEFLLMNQPDTHDGDEEEPLARFGSETEEQFQARFQNERVYRGRLEAIKLTGDPNVARGEYTFVADDLGGDGFVGIAEDPPFQGARVVKSKGHVAGTGFIDDKYIQSQLILISHDRLAQYWVEFGHISFFERVDIDQFLVPQTDCGTTSAVRGRTNQRGSRGMAR